MNNRLTQPPAMIPRREYPGTLAVVGTAFALPAGALAQGAAGKATIGPFFRGLILCGALLLCGHTAWAAPQEFQVPEVTKASGVKVTPETFIRAESDRMFGDISMKAGGLNRFFHFRRPTPLDQQTIVRMNLDTLYSMGIVDTSKGATIIVPEMPKGRYFSVQLIDNNPLSPGLRTAL